MFVTLPPKVTVFAVQQLATVDYTVANRVTDDVAKAVVWACENSQPWLPPLAISSLQFFDNIGSVLISIVVWMVMHTQW